MLTSILAALSLAACGGGPEKFLDPKGSVTVKAGENFVIDLQTNPSVGTDYLLENEPGEGDPIRLVDTELESETDPQTDGGNVRKRFEFEALRAGEVTLDFVENYRDEKETPRPIKVIVTG